jgi:hypothetical protein
MTFGLYSSTLETVVRQLTLTAREKWIGNRKKEILMSDHLDAPGLKPPNMDARVDICDIYVFQKPGDTNKSVLVFNVNPVAPTFADSFASEAVYELKVDVNGDAVAEIAYRFTFSSDDKPFFQIDRMGRPLVNVVFTKDGDKDTFNRIEPTRDRELFTGKFTDRGCSSPLKYNAPFVS